MRKKIVFLFCSTLMIFGFNANAQIEKGNSLINAGIGLGMVSFSGDWDLPSGGFGVNGSYEYMVSDKISFGGQLDHMAKSYDIGFGSTNIYEAKMNITTLAARGSYHFGKLFIQDDNLDLYGGLSTGIAMAGAKIDGQKDNDSKFHLGFHAGGRYLIANAVGVFVEVGHNAAILKAGLSVKF